MTILAQGPLPAGAENAWITWKPLNPLGTLVGQYGKMGFSNARRIVTSRLDSIC